MRSPFCNTRVTSTEVGELGRCAVVSGRICMSEPTTYIPEENVCSCGRNRAQGGELSQATDYAFLYAARVSTKPHFFVLLGRSIQERVERRV